MSQLYHTRQESLTSEVSRVRTLIADICWRHLLAPLHASFDRLGHVEGIERIPHRCFWYDLWPSVNAFRCIFHLVLFIAHAVESEVKKTQSASGDGIGPSRRYHAIREKRGGIYFQPAMVSFHMGDARMEYHYVIYCEVWTSKGSARRRRLKYSETYQSDPLNHRNDKQKLDQFRNQK
jgi:hypothetical protein